MREGFSIRATGHTYVSLFFSENFLFCLDNDMQKAEDIIQKIEKRTRMKIQEIPIQGRLEDFNGFFWHGKMGWHNLITGE